MIKSEKELLEFIGEEFHSYNAIVVEGYDGVGKGRVLNLLSSRLLVTPYRPDYNLWQKYDHRDIDRWKVSGFFWDIFSHFNIPHSYYPLLFDRGVISGAVYNHDHRIAEDYKKLLKDMKVLHILVECSEEDYKKFALSRSIDAIDAEWVWEEYQAYTEEYKECFKIADVPYVEYMNVFNEELFDKLSTVCEGCGHYNYGYCRHPAYNCKVDKSGSRCVFHTDKETQDRKEIEDGSEMQCV